MSFERVLSILPLMNADIENGDAEVNVEDSETVLEVKAPLTLYMYAREQQFHEIINSGKFRLSTPWATNDVTEGVAQEAEARCDGIEKYGYICLSASSTSPAMWGYYAGRATGVCLAFTFYRVLRRGVDCGEIDGGNPIYRVKYQKERGRYNDGLRLMCIKSDEWKHEKEYRILYKLEQAECQSHDGMVAFYTGDLKAHLTGVILGSNCKLKEVEVSAMLKVRNWFNPHRGEYPYVKKARMSKYDFKIVTGGTAKEKTVRLQKDTLITEAYKLIEEFKKASQEWEFHSSYLDEFNLSSPASDRNREDFVCSGTTATWYLNKCVNLFMRNLENFKEDDINIRDQVAHLYKCFDSFLGVKTSLLKALFYIQRYECEFAVEIKELLFDKLLYIQGDDFKSTLWNVPVGIWPKELSDLTNLIRLSLEGDAECSHEKEWIDNWLLPRSLTCDADYSKDVKAALWCTMRGWNAQTRNIDKIVDEIIEILSKGKAES